MNNTSVDSYLVDGCGRCEHFQTPDCKVRSWPDVLAGLRAILRESGLAEEMKWGNPCYTWNGKNVVMMSALREYCAVSFFKGFALRDDEGLLESPGPNSRIARVLKFTSIAQVEERRDALLALVQQAIEIERSGVKIEPAKGPEPMPDELEERLDAEPIVREAFEALTPGRKRSFVIYVSGAKQRATREARVERCIPKILAGKGFNER